MRASLVKGPTDSPLLETTIGRVFVDTVARCGDKEALVVVHQNVRWTWSDSQGAG